jgi:hypothetical protein
VPIRWKRSSDGFVESHDGAWRIVPLYCGCTRPQDYELRRLGEVVASMCGTQRGAKAAADDLARKVPSAAATKRVLDVVRRTPGLRNSQVIEKVGLPRRTVEDALWCLWSSGRIQVEPDSRIRATREGEAVFRHEAP